MLLAVLGVCPAAGAATRLWYRIHVSYEGAQTDSVHRSGGEGQQQCCWSVNEGFDHAEHVKWTAHTTRSVLVRLEPGGFWSVQHGELVGQVSDATVTDDTVYADKYLTNCGVQGCLDTVIDSCVVGMKGTFSRVAATSRISLPHR